MGSPTDQWTLRAQEMLAEVYDLCPELHEGVVRQMTGDLEKELARQKVIERQDMETRKLMDIEEIYNNGTVAFKDGDYWLAVSLFEEAIALDPGRADVKKGLERARAQVRRQNAAAELDISVRENKPAIMDMYLNEAQ
jgi:tetratricopeptide (TPR) repeat protein